MKTTVNRISDKDFLEAVNSLRYPFDLDGWDELDYIFIKSEGSRLCVEIEIDDTNDTNDFELLSFDLYTSNGVIDFEPTAEQMKIIKSKAFQIKEELEKSKEELEKEDYFDEYEMYGVSRNDFISL